MNIKGPSWSDSFLPVIVFPHFPLLILCGSALTISLQFLKHAVFGQADAFAWNDLSFLGT